MKTEDFDYNLDERLIAQTPLEQRDQSRLMILDKKTGDISHQVFNDIVNHLSENDVLVVNNTKVMPARIIGVKEATDAIVELLLLNNPKGDIWETLVKPAKRIKEGTIIKFSEHLSAKCVVKKEEGLADFEFIYDGIFMEILAELGTMPLPPYIKEQLHEQDRYQTVYAKSMGSAAAPTAGLHFTEELMTKIKAKNIQILEVTLHVGLGTFRPVNVEDATKHQMHEEIYQIDEDTAAKLNEYKKQGKYIVAVGTTTVRTLEANYHKHGKFTAESSATGIFIYPGFEFKAIDALITNFHLPKSTLLMLVSALASKEFILNAYNVATKEKYRFFSFGDSMFIK